MRVSREVAVPLGLSALGIILLAFLLASCEQLGLVQPKSLSEKLAYSYVSVTQVRKTASGMLQAKQISAADAKHVLSVTDLARASLDRAQEIGASNETEAMKQIDFANGLITEVQKYLKQKGTV